MQELAKIKNRTFFQLQFVKNKRSAKETARPLRDNKDNLLTKEIHWARKKILNEFFKSMFTKEYGRQMPRGDISAPMMEKGTLSEVDEMRPAKGVMEGSSMPLF